MSNIRNYTSSVPADKSVGNIEKLLVKHGATGIMKEYDGGGNLDSIAFRKLVKGETVSFQLPARVEQVYQLLLRQRKGRPTEPQRKAIYDQAKRTAWKNIHDWVDIQMALIEMEQVEFVEVFLPYAMVGPGQTVYSRIQENGLKALQG